MQRDDAASVLARYGAITAKRTLLIFLMGAALIAFSLFAVSLGAVAIPITDVVGILLGRGSGTRAKIVLDIRLPRILTAIVAGAGLSAAGAAMQGVLRNPIASPFTLGVAHASAFGAAFAIVVLGAGRDAAGAAPYAIAGSAFAFALLSTLVIMLLARAKKASPEAMILTGVALGSLFIAGLTAIQYFADSVELASIIFWTFGDVGRTSWHELAVLSAVVLPSIAYFLFNASNYNALDAGEETARSLGVRVERVRISGLVIASLSTAIIVSFTGIIGFVCIVVPHIVRKILGCDERFLFAGTIVAGPILLLVADTAARMVFSPVVLPVGIVTSFLGAPLFIYLVVKRRSVL